MMKTKIQMSLLALLTSGTMLSANVTGAQVTYSNDQYDYYTIKIYGDTNNMGYFQFFIDTDNNADTGYTHTGINVEGAELMIEGSSSRTYALQCSENGCSENSVQDLAPNEYGVNNERVYMDLPRERYGIGDSFKYRAVFLNGSWSELGSYPSNKRMESYSSVEISSWKSNYAAGENVWIELKNKPNNVEDWVGIYPASSNNDWSNVVDWRWANNTSPTEEDPGDWYKFTGLEVGEYEARFFLNNSFVVEDSIGFSVGGKQYGEPGLYIDDVTEYKPNDNSYVIYYPKEHLKNNSVPVVLFATGGGEQSAISPDRYSGLMKYIASHGCYVIGIKSSTAYIPKNYARGLYDTVISESKMHHPNLDTSRLGIVGHSSGGAIGFSLMKYFLNKGYGGDGNFIISMDGWFAFGMNKEDFDNFNSSTAAAFIQFGGAKGTGTEPRINLSILNLLPNSVEKSLIAIDDTEHMYPAGNSVDNKKSLLAPIHALINHKFFNEHDGKNMLFNGYQDTYNNINTELNSEGDYTYNCSGSGDSDAKIAIEGYNINYCNP